MDPTRLRDVLPSTLNDIEPADLDELIKTMNRWLASTGRAMVRFEFAAGGDTQAIYKEGSVERRIFGCNETTIHEFLTSIRDDNLGNYN